MVAKIKGTEFGILCPVLVLGICFVKYRKEGRQEGSKQGRKEENTRDRKYDRIY